jgi:hypothetical protein
LAAEYANGIVATFARTLNFARRQTHKIYKKQVSSWLRKDWHRGCFIHAMPGSHRRKQEHLMRYFDEQDKIRAKTTMARVGNWLGSRPIESWGFFIAGFLIARIIF